MTDGELVEIGLRIERHLEHVADLIGRIESSDREDADRLVDQLTENGMGYRICAASIIAGFVSPGWKLIGGRLIFQYAST